MKVYRKIVLICFSILIGSNLPYVSEILSVFFYATVAPPFCFITKDAHLYECGGIEKIQESPNYKYYKERFPDADHQLYRCNREREWKYFFMWRIFLTDKNWTAPYIEPPFFLTAYGDVGFRENPSHEWNDRSGKWEKVIYK